MKAIYIGLVMLCFNITGYTQHIIKGRILNQLNNKAISNASIKVIKTGNTMVSDSRGEFSMVISKQENALQISCIGYETKTMAITAKIPSLLVISLIPSEQRLQEVRVYSGYQSIPKERATGSFSTIDQKTFNQQVSTNILSRLPALANGLIADNSTSSGRLMIRGLSTIQGNKQPLIVLDNFPYDGDINNINPNDVENITILKDAAAASIWGSRAGNGVIVINTKKGSYNKPLTINANVNLTVGSKPNLFLADQISSADYIDMEELLFAKGFYTSKINSTTRPALTPIVELLIKKEANTISDEQYRIEKGKYIDTDVRDQYNTYFYSPEINQQYALSMNGGSVNHSWLASAGYDHNKSVLSEKAQRLNLRFQNTYKLVRNLQLSAEVYYSQNKNHSGKPGFGSISSGSNRLYPYAKFADENGSQLSMPQKRQLYLDTVGKGRLLDWNYYPLSDYLHNTRKASSSDLLLNTGLNYTFFKGFSAELKYQYEEQQGNTIQLMDKESYFSRDLVNTYTVLGAPGTSPVYNVPPGGVVDRIQDQLVTNNLRMQFNYNRSWGVQELNLLGGIEVRNTNTRGNAYRSYGYNDELLTFGNADLTRTYPEYVTGANSYIPGRASFSERSDRFISTFFNGSYTWKGKYILSASARRDASNLFGLNTNDKWNPLWSAGASWELSKESFWLSNLVSYLRLRTTYGFSGNVDPSRAAVTTIRYVSNNLFLSTPYAAFSNYANPELKWETSRMINMGLDFRMFDNRLSGSIEYYLKKGYNLYGQTLIDYTAGIGTSVVKNTANMKSTGIDVEINSRNLQSATFSWTTNFNFSYNKDQVTKYYQSTLNGSSFVRNVISGVIGKPVYSVFSYKWVGLNPQTGNPIGYFDGEQSENYSNLTGTKTKLSDLSYGGPRLPVWFGSMGNTFSYNHWSATFRVVYKLGHYFRRNSINYNELFNRGQGHPDYANRWQKPGDELQTNVPSLVYPAIASRDAFYSGSEALVENAGHIRLQYITFSYALNPKAVDKMGINNMSVYLNVNNPGILWRANKHGIDPETDYGGFGTIPNPASYSIGIRASF